MKEGRRINGRHSEGEIYHNQTSTQAEQRTITPNNTQQKENHEHASTNKDTEKNCIILFVSIYQILSILFDCFDLLPCMADEEMTSDCVGLPHKGLRHIPAIQNRFMMNTLTVVNELRFINLRSKRKSEMSKRTNRGGRGRRKKRRGGMGKMKRKTTREE